MEESKEQKEQKVWVTLSETVNTGSYENTKIEAGFSKAYTTENPLHVIENGVNELNTILKKKAKKIRRKAKYRNQ